MQAKLRRALGVAALLSGLSSATTAGAQPAAPGQKQGYWWYETPSSSEAFEINAPQPPMVPWHDLDLINPADIKALLDEQMTWALYSEEPAAVEGYYRLLDHSRRKARIFASLHGQMLLDHPDLNPTADYPTTKAGRTEAARRRNADQASLFARNRGEFGLVMFSIEDCGFCVTQWAVLQHFADQTGWTVVKIDMTMEPDKAARFGIDRAPVTLVLRRGGQQWANVAHGATSLPVVMENTSRQVRMMKGEIGSDQFYTGLSEMGGFFDPNGASGTGRPE